MAKILIVDDSGFQRRLLRKLIEIEGHQVFEAVNGRQGWDLIAAHSPDCIFLDLIMPESNGFELLENLQKENVNIPAIVVTADVQSSTHRQCLELGAIDIINKPVDGKTLKQTLADVLNSRSGFDQEAAS